VCFCCAPEPGEAVFESVTAAVQTCHMKKIQLEFSKLLIQKK
jgi:hypothetical protein